jgi:hypothetical protein
MVIGDDFENMVEGSPYAHGTGEVAVDARLSSKLRCLTSRAVLWHAPHLVMMRAPLG